MTTKASRTQKRTKENPTLKRVSPSRKPYAPKKRGLGTGTIVIAVVVVAIAALGLIYFFNNQGGSSAGAGSDQAGKYAFQAGNPGRGEQAPTIDLPSTTGGTFDLAALRGKTVLLYFQEGLTCQPCWDQLKDIQSNSSQFHSLGIDTIVSITTDPLDALKLKVADEGLTMPVLSDQGLAVSQAYNANSYGMMGNSRDGHSFIVVGPDGRIRWRADYGGAPNYTMYVPVSNLIADIRSGLNGSAS